MNNVCFTRVLLRVCTASRTVCQANQRSRNIGTQALKKFYKSSTISQAEGGGFEINLDKRKLKTPNLKLFNAPTEALALMVSAEWNAQQDTIKKHSMHMTALCNTAIDNPTGRPKDVVIDGILEYLETDTVCYRLDEPEELGQVMSQQWDPLLLFIKERYGVELQATSGLGVPHIPPETIDILKQHLNSYNDWALVGYQHCVESLKSFIITSALVDRYISVEQAVDLSRLETDFQVNRWGNVEWHHDIDKLELRARVAASLLFIHLNSEETRTVFNKTAQHLPV